MDSNDFLVQRSGLGSTAWQTICRNPNREYAEGILARQVRLSSVGRFRLLSPEGRVLAEKTARPLFGNN